MITSTPDSTTSFPWRDYLWRIRQPDPSRRDGLLKHLANGCRRKLAGEMHGTTNGRRPVFGGQTSRYNRG